MENNRIKTLQNVKFGSKYIDFILLYMKMYGSRHDTQHNDIQHDNTQHNDIQHNDIQHNNK